VKRLAVAAGAALVVGALVPSAFAVSDGTWSGSLYQDGKRVAGSNARLVVRNGGDRFTLRARRMRLRCSSGPLRLAFIHRGVVSGERIDDTRLLEGGNNEVRVTGVFVDGRFEGRVRVTGAPGVRAACTGRARIRLTR
jgi:hypothetical protein